jgi:DNA-directed RNA polymerase subunit RPC12/RpoP
VAKDYKCSRCNQAFDWEELVQTPVGNLFCSDCWPKVDPQREPKRKCPVDATEMTKQVIRDVVMVDRCSTCGGIWFDKHELRAVQKMAKQAGFEEGFFSGFLS